MLRTCPARMSPFQEGELCRSARFTDNRCDRDRKKQTAGQQKPLLARHEVSLGYGAYLLDWKADRDFGETQFEPALGGLLNELIPNYNSHFISEYNPHNCLRMETRLLRTMIGCRLSYRESPIEREPPRIPARRGRRFCRCVGKHRLLQQGANRPWRCSVAEP